ncbi:MAG: GNAT family N-acetyltransferase [Ruminococcaceae bacterium]|nr:GNAT family N-acetyltransferase [Oscillospiraceae bacterium]
MKITYENITLRDYVLSDVEDEVRWTNEETEWFRSDTPWMTLEPVDADELRADMVEIMDSMPENAIRWRFEIEVDGRHIGLVSSYYLDSNFEYTPWDSIDQSKNALENHSVRGLGIEICEMDYWGKGIGTKVLTAMMNYYRSFGENHFLIETWSGNLRMLGCAKKLGFYEIKRTKGTHVVDGQEVDDLILEIKF